MAVRAAKFGDMPRLVELGREMHAKSKYADQPGNERVFKATFIEAIRLHVAGKGGCLFVAEKDGVVEGYILGVVCRVYNVCDVYEARDMFFFVTDRADKRDAARLAKALIKWASGLPDVIEINMGATDAISDFGRTEKLYQRLGMSQNGVLYTKRVKP